MVGIVSYGVYVPRYRILPEEIGRVWGRDGKAIGKGLMVEMKSVPGIDEDTVTIAVMAARRALMRKPVPKEKIGAVYVGSESHPYAVKPTATIVAEALGVTPWLTAADMEFACKAGTAGMQAAVGLVKAGMIDYGLAVGADTSQGAPGNILEYTAAAGGAAFLIGDRDVIAEIQHTVSFTTDTPDFWRREGMKYPSHGERFTGKPAYFRHIVSCAKALMERAGTSPEDYTYAVFHQPNGKFPMRVASMHGFKKEQVTPGLWTPRIGNTYSWSTMVGLSGILDVAEPGDRILAVSFGSGAGSDGFDIAVTDAMESFSRDAAPTLKEVTERYTVIDYALYTKFREQMKLEGE